MPLHDRPYMRNIGSGSGGYGGSGMGGLTIGLPRPARAVKYLLAINIAVFLVQMFLDRSSLKYPAGPMSSWGGVTVSGFWQVWRYITCMFLHADPWHIILNMLGVYLFGSPLEQRFGTKKFLTFYFCCGFVAGISYVIIGAIFGLDPNMPIIGASGGVYGIVLACAVFFPHFRVILLFFPVPIRLAAVLIFGGMILLVLQALSHGNAFAAMSDVAHLGGAVAAAVWIWILPKLRMKLPFSNRPAGQGRWEKKLEQQRRQQEKIDRVLDKIRTEGIGSLSRREKQLLREATEEMKNDKF